MRQPELTGSPHWGQCWFSETVCGIVLFQPGFAIAGFNLYSQRGI
jgi:hypothetical protein